MGKYIEEHEKAIERVYHRALIFTMCVPGEVDINLEGQGLDASHIELLMERLVFVGHGVHRLMLAENDLGDDGAIIIAEQIMHLSELMRLHLARNGIGDAGAEAIHTAVKSMPNFRGLDMQGNPCEKSFWIFGKGYQFASYSLPGSQKSSEF